MNENVFQSKSTQSANTLAANPTAQTDLLRSPTIAQKTIVTSAEQEENVSAQSSLPSKESDSFSDMVKNVAQRVFHVQQKPSNTQVESKFFFFT